MKLNGSRLKSWLAKKKAEREELNRIYKETYANELAKAKAEKRIKKIAEIRSLAREKARAGRFGTFKKSIKSFAKTARKAQRYLPKESGGFEFGSNIFDFGFSANPRRKGKKRRRYASDGIFS